MPIALKDFRKAIREVEKSAVEQSQRKIAALTEEHAAMTRSWAKATDDMQAVLKQDIERLEVQKREWEPRMIPLTERVQTLANAERERAAERNKLLEEWPALENREKGEALRRLFKTVTLFWTKKRHPPSARPTRPRKTDRDGRNSYTLDRDAIQWSYAASDLKCSSSSICQIERLLSLLESA